MFLFHLTAYSEQLWNQPYLTSKWWLRNFVGDRATTCAEDIMQKTERDRDIQSGKILATNYNLSLLAMKC